MLPGQIGTEILRVSDGVVRLCYDTVTDSCSIGLRTKQKGNKNDRNIL